MSRHHRRISSRQWERVRRRILIRDGYRCVRCKLPGRLEVDHVKAIDQGGDPLDPANLQTLCRGCHMEKTREELGIDSERQKWRKFLTALAYENG